MGTYHKNALPSGYELAEYSIETVLGHGGFGITYLARDTTLGALVAIKEFLPGEIAQRDGTMRVLPNPDRQAVRDYQAGLKNFVKEARALAHFKHPHIVRVLRFLEANGTAYTVMEYEEGQSLADFLKHQGASRIDEATVLRVFIPVLTGLHAVHEAKMLHLDIKPENIYLRKDGSPMLIDFGSARRAMTETSRAQRIALTHGYAPIEQYPDKGAPGPWTDLYALGASIYRCISGKRPDDALARYQAVLKYKTDPLEPASKLGRNRYQPQLLECVDWAMQIYAKDRPQSARELQDGLMGKRRQTAAAANPNPLAAVRVPPPPTSAAAREMKRSNVRWRIRAALSAGRMMLTIMALGAAIVGTMVYWNEIKIWLGPEREPLRAPAPRVEESAPAPTTPAEPTPATVSKASFPGPDVALGPPTALERTLNGHKDWVQAIAFSVDGRWLATASTDRTIKVWDVAGGALLGTLRGHEGSINSLAYSPDGKWLASASDDGSVRLWDGYSGGHRAVLQGSTGSLFTAVFSPDGKLLASAGRDRTIFIWDVASGKRLAAMEGSKGDVFALAFTPDGKTLASAGADKMIRFWNPQRFEELNSLGGHKDPIVSLVYSPDGRLLASGDAGKTLRVWDARTLVPIRPPSVMGQAMLALAYSPDSRWLAAGGSDGTVSLFDRNERVPSHTVNAHQDHVQSLAFSPDGQTLASGSRDRSARLWKAKPN